MKLKTYQQQMNYLHNDRAENILRKNSWDRAGYLVIVVAESKDEATAHCASRGIKHVNAKDLRIMPDGPRNTNALREAMLLNQNGTVLAIASGGAGQQPVVLMDPEEGAQAIGVLVPAQDLTSVFQASMAKYAGKGSIAAGADLVLLNTGRQGERRWASVYGTTSSDEEVQLALDLGELKIVRCGYGDWWMPGR